MFSGHLTARFLQRSQMTNLHSETVWVWGLPLEPDTFEAALDRIDRHVALGQPSFFITANLNYAMLVDADARLQQLNSKAAFLLADGMPLVWWSRLCPRPLPERVAGSDLIYGMCERAAQHGHRIFLLGAARGVADEAATNLIARYPALQIAGVECPPFRQLTTLEEVELITRIRDAKPQILFVAFGQPKGEYWIAKNLEALGVPVCVQVGASLDFVAGRVKRSPKWMQKTGAEWLYRLAQEPRRLTKRYLDNLLFLVKAVFAARFRKERRSSLQPK